MSESITRNVRVRVAPRFVPQRSDPRNNHWFFAYTVDITNLGEVPVTLVSRHWVITDALGNEEHVKGPGVVGQTPELGPGETFRYTSACPLKTSLGTMHGSYQMVTADGARFNADIGRFTLVEPDSVN